MGSLGINYSHYKHPPMNMSAPGGGVIEDVYAPAPGRTLTGTYEGGENFTLPCYGTSAGVSISYTYSIPDGGSATIDDALIGSIGGVPTDFIPWSSINIGGATTIVGPKYWTDGDPGSTIPQSGTVYATADFLDPTPGTIYNIIRGTSSTGINIYDLTIHASSIGSVCQTAPITGATCALTAATEAHLGPHSQDNFDITYTPAVRLTNTISTTVTFTALKTLYEPFSVDMQALAANDGIAVFSDTPPTCIHPLLISASYAGGTGEIPEEDIYHTPPPIKFVSPGTITEGETWSFDVSIGTAGATCDQVILSIVFGRFASKGPIGYAVLYALITCDEVEPPAAFWISWWEPGSRAYERGVDRGVLYFDDGRVVPWNGLTEVDESYGRKSESVYFDGVKLSEVVTPEGFSSKVSALTYPKQFEEAYGSLSLRKGVYLGAQRPRSFGFSYRTLLGTELDPDAGYKIHIIYNILAIPGNRSYSTISDKMDLTEFEWEFKTVPETAPGYRPSAYVVFDSTKVTPSLLTELEAILYGTPDIPARLPPLPELLAFINGYNNFINIIDYGDGTWEANTMVSGVINDLGGDVFEIQHANIQWTSAETYLISPTPDPPA